MRFALPDMSVHIIPYQPKKSKKNPFAHLTAGRFRYTMEALQNCCSEFRKERTDDIQTAVL
jgi:hypothetical protein